MKKFLFTLFIMSMGFVMQARVDTSVIDTICFVNIGYEPTGSGLNLTAYAFDFENPNSNDFDYLWSTGETTETISISGSGIYCVTATSVASGCVSASCVVIDTDICQVFTWLDWGGFLHAYSDGIPPYTYQWDNGDTTESIPVAVGDIHCVTITDALGCVADTCVTVEYVGIDSFCFAHITPFVDSSGSIVLQAIGGGDIFWPPSNNNTSYLWSTGDTTSTIIVNDLGEYCVTVTVGICSAEACIDLSDSECGLFIGCDPPGTFTAFAYGVAPYTYNWSTGATTQTIPVVAGETYCVTITDGLGCLSDTCMTADTIIIWPPDTLCDVFIEFSFDGTGFMLLANAFPWWGADNDYLWSTGETTESIIGTPGETYCVTVTSGFDGCVSSACIDLDGFDCSHLDVICDPDGTVGVFSSGIPPFTYLWSTGETTEFILGENDSTYCVTITDALDCMADTCVTAMTGPIDTFSIGNVIHGEIYLLDSNNVLSEYFGWVYLYKKNSDDMFDLIDSTQVMGGFLWSGYVFGNVDTGAYITKAVVTDILSGEDYVPTYHLSAMEWDEADIIHVDGTNINGGPIAVYFAPIQLMGTTSLTGPGGINGVISDIDNLTGGDSRNENGIQGVTLILTDMNNHALAFTMSNSEGEFSFSDLPYGTYHLHADYLNVSGPYAVITISAQIPIVDISFQVSGNELFLDNRAIDLNATIDMYPNPVSDKIYIKTNDEVRVESIYVTDLQGRTVLKLNNIIDSNIEIDVRRLNAGIHLLQIMTDHGMINQKVMVLK